MVVCLFVELPTTTRFINTDNLAFLSSLHHFEEEKKMSSAIFHRIKNQQLNCYKTIALHFV